MELRLCPSCQRPIAHKDGTPIDDQDYCSEVCEWYEGLSDEAKREIAEAEANLRGKDENQT